MKRNRYQEELEILFHYVCNAQTFVYSGFREKLDCAKIYSQDIRKIWSYGLNWS